MGGWARRRGQDRYEVPPCVTMKTNTIQPMVSQHKSCALIIVTAFLVSLAVCQETPKSMTRIATRVVEPEPEPGSFAAQTKTCWRAGTKYARIAEAPDAQHHIHALIIIKEPNLWMINLADKSGRHVVDPGPRWMFTFRSFRLPAKQR